MDNNIITHIYLRQHSVDRKLITVLTETAGNIIHMVTRLVLLACHCNMMVCTVDSRTHQVRCTCIQTDILFENMFLMDGCCDQMSIRCQHKTSHLCKDSHITHTCRNKNLIVNLVNALTDDFDIIRCFIG